MRFVSVSGLYSRTLLDKFELTDHAISLLVWAHPVVQGVRARRRRRVRVLDCP